MKFCYITFRSVTHAQRGERVLLNAGLRCTLQRTPRWMEVQGCGYSLRLRALDAAAAVSLLEGAAVPLQKVYVQSENGALEETVI